MELLLNQDTDIRHDEHGSSKCVRQTRYFPQRILSRIWSKNSNPKLNVKSFYHWENHRLDFNDFPQQIIKEKGKIKIAWGEIISGKELKEC